MRGRGTVAVVLAALLAGLSAVVGCAPVVATGTTPASEARVLVFTRTTGFRHDSIPGAVAALRELGADAGLIVDHGEDPRAFNAANLARYRAVVFASTTGDVLDANQQAALEDFIRDGGGFLGLHSAADTEYDWPWYGELVGAWFHSHPPGLQTARLRFADGSAPADAAGEDGWRVTDEFYNFRRNPRPWVQVIATLTTADYAGNTMGADHPIAWCRPFDGGRSWYTGLGHDARVYADRCSGNTSRAACATSPVAATPAEATSDAPCRRMTHPIHRHARDRRSRRRCGTMDEVERVRLSARMHHGYMRSRSSGTTRVSSSATIAAKKPAPSRPRCV